MHITQLRSELFSQWEKCLRGWDVYPYTIRIEPNHIPCPKDVAYHWQANKVDDGRHTTLLSRFAERIRGIDTSGQAALQIEEQPDIDLPTCEPSTRSGNLTELHLVLPQDSKTQTSLMGRLFTTLTFVHEPLSFEVIGTQDEIVVILCCATRDAIQVRQQLTAHQPDCVIDQTSNYLKDHWKTESNLKQVVDFGLEHEAMRPLAIATPSFDALTGVMGALSDLQENECGILQILFEPAQEVWSESLIESVSNYDGSAFFADAPDMLPLAKQKTSAPLVACVIRAAASANNETRLNSILRSIGGSLMQLRDPKSNSLFPLNNDDYPQYEHTNDVVQRTTHRAGMLLNLEELTTIAHMPDASVRIPKLKRVSEKTKAAPRIAKGHELHLGENHHHGITQNVTISTAHRMRHMYVIGTSGTGKSTLMMNMIRQDMENGNGVSVLDPHGDLIETALKYVPEHRLDDVTVFDPSDEEYPIAFNILEAHSELEKTLLSSDLVSVFRRLSSSWGDQMNSVLANGIIAMLESEKGGTLHTLRRFLVDREFRKEHLKTVNDPEIKFYWEKEFPMLSGKPQGPVLTRLDTFLRPKPIRNMVSQKENKIDFADIMQGKKIFLAKLAQGSIGVENSYLLGTLLVTKLNQMAYARQSIPENERQPHYLYIDEFHNFICPSMESILSGTRKYLLSFTLANQDLRQMDGKDADVAASVLSNPFTRVCFRLGDKDAKRLQGGFSYFEQADLQSLSIGQAICRMERSDHDFNLSTSMLPEAVQTTVQEKVQKIVNLSRQKYAGKLENISTSNATNANQYSSKNPKSDSEKLPGRGGTQHKQIQQQVKELGEEAGFRATIEKPIKDESGKVIGHVDVALEREDLKIACEICVTSSTNQEINNIKKCIDNNYDHVLSIYTEKNERLESYIKNNYDAKVVYLSKEELTKLLLSKFYSSHIINGYSIETSIAFDQGNERTIEAIQKSITTSRRHE